MDKIYNVQKNLKRCMKSNRKISFSMGLLISFLITGGIYTYANEYSHQIFFNGDFNRNVNFDNTLKNFSHPDYPETLDNKDKYEYFGSYGVKKINTKYMDFVSFSTDLVPKKAPNISLIEPKNSTLKIKALDNINFDNPEIKDEKINKPQNKPETKKPINIQKIDRKPIDTITLQNNVNIKIKKIEQIQPKDPNYINISATKISNEIKPQNIDIKFDKRIVSAPKLEDFTPPEPKTPVELGDTGFESMIYNEAYKLLDPDNIGNEKSDYNRGIVGQVSITKGTFKINNYVNNKNNDNNDNNGCYFAFKNYDSTPNYYANPGFSTRFSHMKPIKLGDNNQKPEQFDLESFDSADPDLYNISDDIYNVPYDNKRFRTFYGLNSSAFGYFSKDVDISYISNAKNETTGNEYTNKNPNTVIYMETENNSAQTLDNLHKYKVVPDDLYKEIKGYKELSKLKDNDTFEIEKEIFPTGMTLFNSEANVKLLGSYSKFITVTTISGSKKRLSVFNNNGNISTLNYSTNEDDKDIKNQIIFYSTPDSTPKYSDFQRYIYSNGQKGKINIYSKNAIGMYFTESGRYGFQNKLSTAFINNGTFNIYGANSTGVSLKRPAALGEKSGIYLLKPINIFGDEAVGVFLPGDVSNVPEENLQLRVNIGEKGNNKEKVTWTDVFPGNEAGEDYDAEDAKPKDIVIPNVGNIEGNSEDNVDYSIGLFYANSNKAKIKIADIKLGQFAKNSTAIFASDGELHISKGTINIDGESNIGLLSQKNGTNGGKIAYVGDITASGKKNKLAYTDNKDISIKGKVSSKSKDSVSIYADTGTIDLTEADLDINISGENVAAGYAVNNGKIKLKDESKIKITNDTPSNGTALVAKTGGVIEAKKAKIDIRNIVAGLSASDNNSKIDFTGGTLNYDGEGYSIYTDGKGKIDLSDANITLKGKAIGFDVDQNENSEQNVILNNMTRIKPESDDVILFNLKNSSDLDTKGGIRDHIISRIETKLKKTNPDINLTQLVTQPKAGEPGEFYKVSAMEGGNIKIGSLDKSAVSTDDINGVPDTEEKKAKKDGFQFYNRLHIQRLVATTHENSKISAILDNKAASKFNNQVVALELSSSPSATSNAETQINIVKSNIIADRTEEGSGAIGLFINYGKIDVDKGSTISVENEEKFDNKQAVGIYAVNGSEVSNKGNVTVGSSNSIGILGENYRKATNNLEKDNFGDGKINISNTGTIEIKGANSTGIYANNIDKEITDNNVVNSGNIIASGEHSNGIYSHKGTVSNTGTIELGDKNVGIYSDSSNIKELGTIKFNSNDSTAIFVKGNSTIESGKTLTIESKDKLSGNVGLYSENDLETDLVINAKGKKITSYYTKSKALTVNADITTSEDGVGINGDNGSITYGKDKTLKVSKESFGILSHNSDVTLNGNIQLDGELGKGIYFDSSEKKLNISGNINVNAKNVIGSYISNVTDSTKLTLNTPITFGENSEHSIAYLFNKSKFNNTSFTELKSKGTQHNTYIFALSENKINLGSNEVSIKSEDGQKGFTGIYLGETNKLTGDKITVSDKATGIYSKNNNTVEIKNIEVDGQDTVGIYSEKNTTLNSINISSRNSAVGIYGKEGEITFSGDNILNLSSKGTGIYLEYASLNGGNIKLVNKDTPDKKDNLVGVYFKDSKSSVNTSNISIDNGTKLIGLYLDNAKVSNKGKIEATSGSSNTLAFVANGSTFKNTTNGTLNLTSSDSHAIYVNDGIAENTGNITVDNEGNKPSVAMTGMKTDKDVNLTNDGNITVHNNSIGMYLDNGAIGNNKKEIVAQKKDSVGVYVNGNTTQFTNTGKISADNIGVYLNNTEKCNIKKLGSVTLTNDNAVAVYANDSKVDFEIKPTVKEGELPNNLISLYATGSTEISSKIYTANGKNSIGIYLKDNKVSFNDAYVKITEGHEDKNGVSYNTGIYADSEYKGDLKVNIENTAKNTIGIAVSEGATVNYSGNITTGKDSIGILTKGNLVTKNSTFNIDGGTGIFVDNTADAKIGTEDTKMNLSNKATAIYQNGGKLTLGDKLKFGENSIGTLLISRNAEVDSNISYSVKTDSLGIGLYYEDAKDHNFTSNGTITLSSDKATGIYAQSTGTGTSTLKNNGKIIASEGIKNNIGIYADNVNVENNKVSVGEQGVGIYLTKKVDLKNKEITLNGEHSVGIYSEDISNGSNYSVGKITSEKDNQTGLFIFNEHYDENKNITLSNLDINLANKSKGVGLQNATYTINEGSKITVGDNSTGLAFKNAKANVKAKITVGENSLALYAQGEKNVTFEGKIEAGKNSKWVYAKGNANITLNKFDNFTVNGGLGLVVDNATITADKETTITVNDGTGAYINEGKIDKFKIDVQNGLGLYIQNGYNGTLPTVSLIGNNSKAYVLESLNKEFKVNDNITLDKTNQIYIYSKGTGKGIDVKDIQIKGSDSYGIYNLADQDILAKDLNISGSNSFGIYSTVTDGTKKINVNKITVTGENSAGVYSKNGTITQTGDIISQGLGIYSEKGSVTLNGSKISLDNSNGIGVKAKNSNITISNAMTISDGKEGATGIYSEGTGDITFNNNLVVNKDIIGVYKNGKGTINLNGSSIFENGIGVYSKGAEVKNAGSLNVTNKNAKGIYVENANITSNGAVTINGENAIGLAGKNGVISSTGDISVKGKDAVGIYSDEAEVTSTGKITSNSIGIYSKGTKDITQSGDITVNQDAVGIFKEGNGNVNISSKDVTVGDKGYALYYLNESNKRGNITANIENMKLGNEAIGIYTKNGDLTYNGNINVGEKKNSAGIYADNSDVTFKGTLNVSKPETIGIFAKGQSNVTIKNGSTINVSNGSYGIMTNEDSTGSITIEQGATFNVNNLAYGISAYGKNTIINKGTFNIDANSTGIFHSFDSTISGSGNIPSDKIKTLNKKADVAGIDIKFNGEVKFPKNIEVVNGGTIKVNGTVDINNMYLDFEHDNKPIIDANSIKGTAIVTSNFSMGNRVNKLVYQDVFRPRSENGFGKFAGDVTSQSASWIAKISKTEPDTKTYDIMMVRIPYTVMFKGEKNSQLGKSLEEIRSTIPTYSKIFKDLDNVSTEKELTDTIANIRGDIYSNIQERMLDVDNTFDKSYKEVLDSHNVTDRVHKFSVIYSKNKHIDETLGVSSYDKDSYGILYLNDRENGANKYGFSVGLICSKFNFTGPTSLGSSEEMRSGKFGLHYQRTKDNLKYLTRLELGVNKHITNRVSNVNGMKYKYNANYWSYNIDWKNRLSYDIDVTKDFRITPYANLDVTYGKIFGINEDALTDPTLKLSIKPNSYFVITPRIGIDAKYDIELKNDMHISLKGNLEYHYDLNELYKRVNMAKFSSVTDYYELSIPGYRRSGLKVGGEVEIGKKDRYGVTFGATYDRAMKYSLRFNYKF